MANLDSGQACGRYGEAIHVTERRREGLGQDTADYAGMGDDQQMLSGVGVDCLGVSGRNPLVETDEVFSAFWTAIERVVVKPAENHVVLGTKLLACKTFPHTESHLFQSVIDHQGERMFFTELMSKLTAAA